MEQEVNHLRRTNAVNSRNAALANLPDSFKNIDTTRKTCVQKTEEEGDLEEDEWIGELRKQEALQEEEYLRENNDIGETAEYSNDNTNEWGILNETEFEEFIGSIGKAPFVLSEVTETTTTTHLNLRPEWSKNGEDMYPELNTEESHKNQSENGHQNAPKISCDEREDHANDGMERCKPKTDNDQKELTKMTAIYESSQ